MEIDTTLSRLRDQSPVCGSFEKERSCKPCRNNNRNYHNKYPTRQLVLVGGGSKSANQNLILVCL